MTSSSDEILCIDSRSSSYLTQVEKRVPVIVFKQLLQLLHPRRGWYRVLAVGRDLLFQIEVGLAFVPLALDRGDVVRLGGVLLRTRKRQAAIPEL